MKQLTVNKIEYPLEPVFGSGGKGGGVPREWRDTELSRQSVKALIAINDGEIESIDEYTIFLNNLPINNYTHLGVEWGWSKGTIDQSPIGNFSDTEAPIPSFQTSELQYMIPVQITVPFQANAVRLTFQVAALRRIWPNNELSLYWTFIDIKTKQNYAALEVQAGRAQKIGKMSAPSAWDVIVNRPAGSYEAETDWIIVLRRETWDDVDMGSKFESKTSVTSAIQLFYRTLSYPEVALIYVGFSNAKIFGGRVPDIKFKPKGRIMYLPTNYDGNTKIYTGTWDGTFKTNKEYSNNPVWIILDVLTEVMPFPIPLVDIDIGNFYLNGKYCDELVSDGVGGSEPRYRFDYCFTEKLNTTEFFARILTIINGTFTTNQFGQVALSIDRGGVLIDKIVTNSNVIDEEFIYTSNTLDERYSQVNVTFDDPKYKGDSNIASFTGNSSNLVNGIDLLDRYGLVTYEIALNGCMSHGQALRKARHEIWVNSIETELVSFKVLLEGMSFYIGQLSKLVDTNNYINIAEGRIATYSLISTTGIAITLDKFYLTSLVSSGEFKLTCYSSEGDFISNYLITSFPEDEVKVGFTKTVVINFNETQASFIPLLGGTYIVEKTNSEAKVFRVLSIGEQDKVYTITAKIHSAEKFTFIDEIGALPESPVWPVDPTHVIPPPPTNITVTQSWTSVGWKLSVTWFWGPEIGVTSYAKFNLMWRKDGKQWNVIENITENAYDIVPAWSGVYDIAVTAIDTVSAMSSPPAVGNYPFNVAGQNSPLFAPKNIQLTGNG